MADLTVSADVDTFMGAASFAAMRAALGVPGIADYATTPTAGATTTLLANSPQTQRFTGTLAQNCDMPVTSTLQLGQTFRIINDSTGVVTVRSSGANSITALQPGGGSVLLTCVLASGTTAASWHYATTFGNSSQGGNVDTYAAQLIFGGLGASRTAYVGPSGFGLCHPAVQLNRSILFGMGGSITGVGDAQFSIEAANVFEFGMDGAVPLAQTLKSADTRPGTDTNASGANLTLASGRGTGNAAGSQLLLQTPVPTTPGTGAQSHVTGWAVLSGAGKASAYTVATLPAAATVGLGGIAAVSDATQAVGTALGTAPTGGGAVKRMVYCDGAAWLLL